MAQKNVATPKSADVDTALLHLLELAALHDGQGIPFEHPDGHCGRDAETLSQVVALLLAHRRQQREYQVGGLADHLSTRFGEIYAYYQNELKKPPADAGPEAAKAWKRSVDQEYEKQITEFCRALGLEPDDDVLVTLAINRAKIKERNGPIEAAKISVSELLGIGDRTVGYLRKSGRYLQRSAFGRWAPLPVLKSHIDIVFNRTRGLRPDETLPWKEWARSERFWQMLEADASQIGVKDREYLLERKAAEFRRGVLAAFDKAARKAPKRRKSSKPDGGGESKQRAATRRMIYLPSALAEAVCVRLEAASQSRGDSSPRAPRLELDPELERLIRSEAESAVETFLRCRSEAHGGPETAPRTLERAQILATICEIREAFSDDPNRARDLVQGLGDWLRGELIQELEALCVQDPSSTLGSDRDMPQPKRDVQPEQELDRVQCFPCACQGGHCSAPLVEPHPAGSPPAVGGSSTPSA